MVKGHRDAIALFENTASQTKDEEVRNWPTKSFRLWRSISNIPKLKNRFNNPITSRSTTQQHSFAVDNQKAYNDTAPSMPFVLSFYCVPYKNPKRIRT